MTGVNDQGSGALTMQVQVVAHELQLPMERVRLLVAGTDSGPWDSGSSAARVTHVAGQATIKACADVREKLAAVTAESLGCLKTDVEFVKGAFRNRNRPSEQLVFAEIAAKACADGEPISGYGRYEHWGEMPSGTSFVAHVVEVEVDRETGQVRLRRVLTATDVGTMLNPMAVTGQLDGALIMGYGAAIMEELPLMEGRVQAAGFHEYKLTSIADIPPRFQMLITDGVGPGPYGAKGVSELGHLPLPPAVINAVYDATGVRLTQLPVTAERVYESLIQVGKRV
jgi:CO/xanthine dehydrogenase Mo-binding subunit